MNNFYAKAIKRRILLLEQLDFSALDKAIGLLEKRFKEGGKVLVFGNGGSATQASHFAAELVNRFYKKRKALPAIALATDMANLTSIANDEDFQLVFSRQLEALANEGDIAVGITTSGKSENILEAIRTARKRRLRSIVLTGENTQYLKPHKPDLVVSVPSADTPLIQEVHLLFLHFIAETLESRLFSEG